jgi:hypothetical protein
MLAPMTKPPGPCPAASSASAVYALVLVGLTATGGLVARPALATDAAAQPRPAVAVPAHKAQVDANTRFQRLANEYIEARWRLDPDAAISAGRYEFAHRLPAPDGAMRARTLAFTASWLKRFEAVDAKTLGAASRTDLGQLLNKLRADRFALTELREHEWNPPLLNVAGPIDHILSTDYAPLPVRLRALASRLAQVPAYYRAGASRLKKPTLEHTQLALDQAPGVLIILDEVRKAAESGDAAPLSEAERKHLAGRIDDAKSAVEGYRTLLKKLLAEGQATGNARSFRLGRMLYEKKFGYEIQSAKSAEQTYRHALVEREAMLTQMAQLADQLWTPTVGSMAKPDDRFALISAVIGKISEQHVRREDFLPEIRAQISQLERWITDHDLLTQDPSKPLTVR